MYRWAVRQPQERGLRSFMREIRLLFDMQHKVRIPKEYKSIAEEVRSPLLRDAALRITASLTKDPPVMQIQPRGVDADSKRAAAIGSKWLSAMTMEEAAMAGEDNTYLSVLALVRDSESVLKTVHRPDAWANFPDREATEEPDAYLKRVDKYRKGAVVAPFAQRAVDRESMVFGDGEYGDDWCIEYGEYAPPYLKLDQPTTEINPATQITGTPAPEARGQFASRSIKLEYFGPGDPEKYPRVADTWAVVINGKMAPGFPKPNPYAPFLPYSRAKMFPALYALRWLVPALDALLTMQMNWTFLGAYPIPIIETVGAAQAMLDALPVGDGQAGTVGENAAPMWEPGKVWFPPPGYTMRFLEVPPTGAALTAMIADLREMIDVAGIPSVMRGVGGSRQAGYAINQLYAAAQMSYKKITEAAQRQQENAARLRLHMVKATINQPVYAIGEADGRQLWLGVKPDGELTKDCAPVDELGRPVCLFRPMLPTDEQAQSMIGIQELNSPHQMLSHARILKTRYQLEDPQAELDDIETEKALTQEPLYTIMVRQAMREAGLKDPNAPKPPTPPTPAAPVQVNDATNRGEPTVPLLTQPAQTGPTGIPGNNGGRPAGMNPVNMQGVPSEHQPMMP